MEFFRSEGKKKINSPHCSWISNWEWGCLGKFPCFVALSDRWGQERTWGFCEDFTVMDLKCNAHIGIRSSIAGGFWEPCLVQMTRTSSDKVWHNYARCGWLPTGFKSKSQEDAGRGHCTVSLCAFCPTLESLLHKRIKLTATSMFLFLHTHICSFLKMYFEKQLRFVWSLSWISTNNWKDIWRRIWFGKPRQPIKGWYSKYN